MTDQIPAHLTVVIEATDSMVKRESFYRCAGTITFYDLRTVITPEFDSWCAECGIQYHLEIEKLPNRITESEYAGGLGDNQVYKIQKVALNQERRTIHLVSPEDAMMIKLAWG
jgi:hypothetical protein